MECRCTLIKDALFLIGKIKAFSQNLAVRLNPGTCMEIAALLILCEKLFCGFSELFTSFVDKLWQETELFSLSRHTLLQLCTCASAHPICPKYLEKIHRFALMWNQAIYYLGSVFRNKWQSDAGPSSSPIRLADQILLCYELYLATSLKICLQTVAAAWFDRNALHCIPFLILQGLLLIHVPHSCSFIYATGRDGSWSNQITNVHE